MVVYRKKDVIPELFRAAIAIIDAVEFYFEFIASHLPKLAVSPIKLTVWGKNWPYRPHFIRSVLTQSIRTTQYHWTITANFSP